MPFEGDIGHLGSVNGVARRQQTLTGNTSNQGIGALRVTGMTRVIVTITKSSNAASGVSITPQVALYPDGWYQIADAQTLGMAVGSFLRFEFTCAANVVRLLVTTSGSAATTDLDVVFQATPF